MRPAIILGIFGILILYASTASGYFLEVTPVCDGKCIVYKEIKWDFNFENKGQKDLRIIGVQVMDLFNDTEIAGYQYKYSYYDSNKQEYLQIMAGKQKNLTLTSAVPAPNFENRLFYQPCITFAVDSMDAVYTGNYTERYCYTNDSIMVYTCLKNNGCSKDSVCDGGACKKLECGECQFADSHKCMDYECCSSEVCAFNHGCMNHECVRLECAANEGYFNHSCQILNCRHNEVIMNHTCIPCADNEAKIKETCVPLSCANDEAVYNNSCHKINCSYDEGAINHTCKKLKCEMNQTIENHECMPIECSIFYALDIDHCSFDEKFLIRLVIEVLLILLITSLGFLDYERIFYRPK